MVFQWNDLLQEALPFDITLPIEDEPYFSILIESCSGQIFSFQVTSDAQNVTYTGTLSNVSSYMQQTAIDFQVQ